jgi:hypothetical protein
MHTHNDKNIEPNMKLDPNVYREEKIVTRF